jgi:uncharacterized repeat protein (TIGR01451 family)
MQSFLPYLRAIEQSQQLMKCRQILDRLLRHCSGVGLLAAPLLLAQPALAEGSYQIGLNQPLFEYDARNGLLTSIDRPIYVNSVSPGEVINVSLCGSTITDDVRVEIYRHAGSLTNYQGSFPAGTLVSSQALTSGNVSCTDTFNAPLTSPIRYTATAPGTYEVRLYNTSVANGTLRRFDITVTPDAVTNPDPRLTQGRIWSYNWGFNAGSFAQTAATNTDYFVVVPGGYPGTSVVWKLDLNNFAGFVYEIMANDTGVNSPNTAGKIVAGLSVPFSGNAITPRFQQYLSFPNLPIVPPPQPSTITNLLFTDNAGVDSTISPGATAGIQDSGFFKFTTDTDGTYTVVIDTSSSTGGAPDGIYGAGDVFLLGRTIAGVENVVPWDGRDNNGNLLPVGSYNVRVQSRLGEYHFLAGDAETSGGTAKGLSIYRASSNLTQANTLMYWDDITGLPGVSGGTTTLPNGLLSSDANGHKWGDFTATSFGNERFIDTYVYVFDTAATALATIASNDIPLQISGKVWNDANGNLAQDGSESIVDGSVVAPLYANLINSSGDVVETVSVSSTGTYKLTDVRLNTTYTVQLSTTIGIVGQPKPATTLPNGWANTGENKAGTTETITPGEIIVTISGGGVLNHDFGIEQLPDTTDLNPASQTNPGGTVTIQVPTLAGTDPEDGALGSSQSFKIVDLPTNGTLTYNNTSVTAGQVISNYDPTLLKLDPDDGAITVSFTYAAIDSAGKEDPTPAIVTMPFAAPSPGGSCNAIYGSYAPSGTSSFTLRQINSSTGASTIIPTPPLQGGRGSLAMTPDGQRFYFLGLPSVNPRNELKYYDVQNNVVVSTGVSVSSSTSNPFRMAIEPTGTNGYSSRQGEFKRFQLSNNQVTSLSIVDVGPTDLAFSQRPGGDIWFAADGSAYVMARRGGNDPIAQFDNFMYRLEINDTTVTATFLGQITSSDSSFVGLDANGLAVLNGKMYIGGGAAGGTANAEIWSVDLVTFVATKIGTNNTEAGVAPGDLTSCEFPILAPNVSSDKIVNDLNTGTVLPGDELEYTITVRNAGNISAGNVRLQDPIPTGTTYVASSTTLNGTAVPDNAGAMPFAAASSINSPGQLPGALLVDTTPGTSGDREATIKFRIKINTANPPAKVSNQATITYNGGPAGGVTSDNPTTPDKDSTDIAVVNNPNVLLVKRITAINNGTTTIGGDSLADYKNDLSNPYDDNTLDNPAPTPLDTNKWLNPNAFLIGGINGGTTRPGDELEYTIYFLSAGDASAKGVLFCDRIPTNVTFLPTAFNSFANQAEKGLPNSDRGILWLKDGATESLTNIADGDAAQYFPPGADPTAVYPKVNCGGANTNGAIVVNLRDLPNATSPGSPPESYGFVRFRGKVK